MLRIVESVPLGTLWTTGEVEVNSKLPQNNNNRSLVLCFKGKKLPPNPHNTVIRETQAKFREYPLMKTFLVSAIVLGLLVSLVGATFTAYAALNRHTRTVNASVSVELVASDPPSASKISSNILCLSDTDDSASIDRQEAITVVTAYLLQTGVDGLDGPPTRSEAVDVVAGYLLEKQLNCG